MLGISLVVLSGAKSLQIRLTFLQLNAGCEKTAGWIIRVKGCRFLCQLQQSQVQHFYATCAVQQASSFFLPPSLSSALIRTLVSHSNSPFVHGILNLFGQEVCGPGGMISVDFFLDQTVQIRNSRLNASRFPG